MLVLALDPEVRRKVRDVREDRYERGVRLHSVERVLNSAIEVWDERDNQIGPPLLPIARQHTNLAPVEDADRKVHHADHLGRSGGPPAAQHDVVYVLAGDAGVLLDEID